MSNHKIRELMAHISNLDQYSQLSILGSWAFSINSSIINTAMRYAVTPDNTNGVEGFTGFEVDMRYALQEAAKSSLPALLSLRRDINSMIVDAGGETRDLDNTLEYLLSNPPSRKRFEEEYETRRRSGMRPAMTIKVFVDSEMARALKQHEDLKAKGTDAIRLCESFTLSDDGERSDIPDWVPDSFENAMLRKLQDRWMKLEITRTNPRSRKQIRDGAEADQLLITQLMAVYGERPMGDEPIDLGKPLSAA